MPQMRRPEDARWSFLLPVQPTGMPAGPERQQPMTHPDYSYNEAGKPNGGPFPPSPVTDPTTANRERIFALIAHDLRNLLQPLRGYVEMLVQELNRGAVTPIKIDELALNIHHASDSMLDLLESLLAWSRRATIFRPEPVQLHQLVDTTFKVLRQQAAAKQIAVSNTVSTDLVACGDSQMLAAVLRNLVGNAIKFTPAGGQVHLTAGPADQPGWLWVEVADTGIGLSAEVYSRLFNGSVLSPQPGTTGESGSGLGLLLCREMVEQHGGRIWLSASQPGQGTRIRFTVPEFE